MISLENGLWTQCPHKKQLFNWLCAAKYKYDNLSLIVTRNIDVLNIKTKLFDYSVVLRN